LNVDAAKAMKYGGLSEEEALKLCTLNPAKQLRLDQRLGSVDVGKDADLAIWTGHPLSTYSRVETTLIEGDVYFDRAHDLANREAMAREKRDRLKKESDDEAKEKKEKKDKKDAKEKPDA
ncbi:MAG: amidohydrolase family protein, partial [Thermoanaerobaculia bacterium]